MDVSCYLTSKLAVIIVGNPVAVACQILSEYCVSEAIRLFRLFSIVLALYQINVIRFTDLQRSLQSARAPDAVNYMQTGTN